MLFLLLSALFPSALSQSVCQTCSVFSYIDAKLQCSNPSTCAAEFCYFFVVPDRRHLFLSGCVDDIDAFPSGVQRRTICRSEKHIGLCVCKSGDSACNVELNQTLYSIETEQMPMDIMSQTTTGYRIDYVRTRVLQMHLDGYPLTFQEGRNVRMISMTKSLGAKVFIVLLSSIVVSLW